ncbi:MAG: hypothetical protein GF311_15740 [Candidatus Lokiarchaeota archaeon]|nr:hypothetical protein [Candidatus Lokiarchaeota archaeon]
MRMEIIYIDMWKIYMTLKNISIRLYLYKKLKKLKVKDGTFSDLIEKLLDEEMNPRFDNQITLN